MSEFEKMLARELNMPEDGIEHSNQDVFDWSARPEVKNDKIKKYTEKRLTKITNQWIEGKDPFPESKAPDNPDLKFPEKYKIVPEYEWVPERHDHSLDQSQLYWGKAGESEALHKIHLNIEAKDVQTVSEYLKKQQIHHKYIHGGEIEDGKIFTVYCGSYDRAKKIAEAISQNLSAFLRKPIYAGDIEYAPNVVGRFQADQNDRKTHQRIFSQYPLGKMRGVPADSLALNQISYGYNVRTEEEKKTINLAAVERSVRACSDIYGAYFYGTKEPKFEDILKVESNQ